MKFGFKHIFLGMMCGFCSINFMPSYSYAADKVQTIIFDSPKFVSLKNNLVPLRTGPGLRFPIEWEYHAKSLPVQVLAKREGWVKIKDFGGTTGWVIRRAISGKRTFSAIATVSLKHYPDKSSSPVAIVEAGCIGDIISCPHTSPGFCRVEVQGYQGWLARSEIFGVSANEYIE